MARFSGAFTTGGAGSTTLPMASLYSAGAANRPRVREVGVFNTTTTGFQVALRRATTAGGTHTGREELPEDSPVAAAAATLFDVDTGTAPTITAGSIRAAALGAAIGSGVIWTFGGNGLVVPEGTANGVVIIGLTTPQVCTVYFVWDDD